MSTESNDAYLVFETGGAKLVAGVAGPGGRLIETEKIYREPADRARKSFARLTELGRALFEKRQTDGARFRAVGFGFGGTVYREARKPHRCLHEQGWEELDVAAALEKEFGIPVFIENDCKLAALAEAHFGAGKGCHTVFYVTLGTGVGGGIVRGGRIQAFSDIGEAEIGHVVVEPEGLPCWCGGRGCVESVCSGPGMSQLAGLMAEQRPVLWRASALKDKSGSAASLTSKQLMEAWPSGDGFAAEVIERAAAYLAEAIAAAVNLIAPDVVVVGGGVGSGNPDFLALVSRKTSERVVVYFRDRFRMVPSALGEQVVSQGAAILAAQQVESA